MLGTADPEAMRRAALVLNQRAEELRRLVHATAAHLATLSYAGPAADRFRSTTNDETARLVVVAANLDDGAARLQRAAVQAELDAAARSGRC